jgi:hypothetical protein
VRKKGISSRDALVLISIVAMATWCFDLAAAQTITPKTASCNCYCGINISPPCSDDACKRACGWKDPSRSGQSAGSVPSKAGAIMGVMQQYNAERQRQDQQTIQTNQELMQSLDAMSKERVQSEDEMIRSKADRDRQKEERNRSEALSTLKGVQETGELSQKSPISASSPAAPLKQSQTPASKPKLTAACEKNSPNCPGNLVCMTFFCGGSTGCPYVCCPRGAPYLNHCDCNCYSTSEFDCGSYSHCKEQ